MITAPKNEFSFYSMTTQACIAHEEEEVLRRRSTQLITAVK